MASVQASVKCYIVDANSYNILLRLQWIRQTYMYYDYNKEEVYIKGHDSVYHKIDMQLALINNDELPTMIINNIDDKL